MAIKLTTTKKAATCVKMLVFGQAGAGKTTLCATAPKPLIISAESGLLALQEHDIPVIEVHSLDDLAEAYLFVTTDKKGKAFETICLDSITDIAEVALSELKKSCGADPRKAYGELSDKIGDAIRSFRDLPNQNVYFTAKVKTTTDNIGMAKNVPSMPGNQLLLNLPYWFDLVLAMRIGETENEKGEKIQYRYLQTEPDLYWESKDRSGRLAAIEEPNLTKLFNKVLTKKQGEK